MPHEVPEGLQKALQLVGGDKWPEGDEAGLRRIGDAWQQLLTALDALDAAVQRSASGIGEHMRGDFSDAYQEWVNSTIRPAIDQLRSNAATLSTMASNTAADIQYTRISIISQLVMVAATLALQWLPGIGQALTASAVATARAVITTLIKQVLTSIAKWTLINLAIGAGLDVAIQGGQMLAGTRTEWNAEMTKGAVIGSAVGGAMGGAVSGAFGGVMRNALGGNLGENAARLAGAVDKNTFTRVLGADLPHAGAVGLSIWGAASATEQLLGEGHHPHSVAADIIGALDNTMRTGKSRGHAGGSRMGNYGDASVVPEITMPTFDADIPTTSKDIGDTTSHRATASEAVSGADHVPTTVDLADSGYTADAVRAAPPHPTNTADADRAQRGQSISTPSPTQSTPARSVTSQPAGDTGGQQRPTTSHPASDTAVHPPTTSQPASGTGAPQTTIAHSPAVDTAGPAPGATITAPAASTTSSPATASADGPGARPAPESVGTHHTPVASRPDTAISAASPSDPGVHAPPSEHAPAAVHRDPSAPVADAPPAGSGEAAADEHPRPQLGARDSLSTDAAPMADHRGVADAPPATTKPLNTASPDQIDSADPAAPSAVRGHAETTHAAPIDTSRAPGGADMPERHGASQVAATPTAVHPGATSTADTRSHTSLPAAQPMRPSSSQADLGSVAAPKSAGRPDVAASPATASAPPMRTESGATPAQSTTSHPSTTAAPAGTDPATARPHSTGSAPARDTAGMRTPQQRGTADQAAATARGRLRDRYITPDGDCLYNAVRISLAEQVPDFPHSFTNASELRAHTASWLAGPEGRAYWDRLTKRFGELSFDHAQRLISTPHAWDSRHVGLPHDSAIPNLIPDIVAHSLGLRLNVFEGDQTRVTGVAEGTDLFVRYNGVNHYTAQVPIRPADHPDARPLVTQPPVDVLVRSNLVQAEKVDGAPIRTVIHQALDAAGVPQQQPTSQPNVLHRKLPAEKLDLRGSVDKLFSDAELVKNFASLTGLGLTKVIGIGKHAVVITVHGNVTDSRGTGTSAGPDGDTVQNASGKRAKHVDELTARSHNAVPATGTVVTPLSENSGLRTTEIAPAVGRIAGPQRVWKSSETVKLEHSSEVKPTADWQSGEHRLRFVVEMRVGDRLVSPRRVPEGTDLQILRALRETDPARLAEVEADLRHHPTHWQRYQALRGPGSPDWPKLSETTAWQAMSARDSGTTSATLKYPADIATTVGEPAPHLSGTLSVPPEHSAFLRGDPELLRTAYELLSRDKKFHAELALSGSQAAADLRSFLGHENLSRNSRPLLNGDWLTTTLVTRSGESGTLELRAVPKRVIQFHEGPGSLATEFRTRTEHDNASGHKQELEVGVDAGIRFVERGAGGSDAFGERNELFPNIGVKRTASAAVTQQRITHLESGRRTEISGQLTGFRADLEYELRFRPDRRGAIPETADHRTEHGATVWLEKAAAAQHGWPVVTHGAPPPPQPLRPSVGVEGIDPLNTFGAEIRYADADLLRDLVRDMLPRDVIRKGRNQFADIDITPRLPRYVLQNEQRLAEIFSHGMPRLATALPGDGISVLLQADAPHRFTQRPDHYRLVLRAEPTGAPVEIAPRPGGQGASTHQITSSLGTGATSSAKLETSKGYTGRVGVQAWEGLGAADTVRAVGIEVQSNYARTKSNTEESKLGHETTHSYTNGPQRHTYRQPVRYHLELFDPAGNPVRREHLDSTAVAVLADSGDGAGQHLGDDGGGGTAPLRRPGGRAVHPCQDLAADVAGGPPAGVPPGALRRPPAQTDTGRRQDRHDHARQQPEPHHLGRRDQPRPAPQARTGVGRPPAGQAPAAAHPPPAQLAQRDEPRGEPEHARTQHAAHLRRLRTFVTVHPVPGPRRQAGVAQHAEQSARDPPGDAAETSVADQGHRKHQPRSEDHRRQRERVRRAPSRPDTRRPTAHAGSGRDHRIQKVRCHDDSP
ncbi:hypothetical protein GCM10011581_02910 [Saccharopolyspora subtropica]|uniref:OTU domain-containing protein n=1 Tax=Saccharopolyspora thermophila TaxID=89367 RepID=A0A917JJP0_9PSEU|nr:OTU domain-containing protein [Saccharopolyspora subtropica]GGI69323.1 hypothetical protein GCM10011581_02910 [Saccharopolyspora subtropica]